MLRIISRGFRSSAPKSNLLKADESTSLTHVFHKTGLALAVLTPSAFLLSTWNYQYPVDVLLGVLFPLHSHIALNCVVSDYVPKAFRGAARASVLGTTVLAAAGLLRLNLQGVGITDALKSLWREPEDKKATVSKK